jgi:4-carboxymuconolactone decarboxylase
MITNERIAPLDPAEFTSEQAELVGAWTHLNFSRVLIRHPGMYGTFVPYLTRLIADTELRARDRQLVCLRMLELGDDTYEQTHHVVISRKCGLTDADIEAAISGEGITDWDRVVLRATEDIFRDQNVSDASWSALAEVYSERQLMEFVFLAGCYLTMAMLTKSFGMQLEGNLESFNALRAYAEQT